MKTGTYYLNNNGSRWIHLPKEKIRILTPDGKIEYRTPIYFESFGNFASVTISWKGKRLNCLMDSDESGAFIDINKWSK